MKCFVLAVILSVTFCTTYASTRIAVLDFELNDITALPNTPTEQQRTASMQNLLEQALVKNGDYEIIHINLEEQAKANSSFGYLFRFDDLAAKLAEQFDADWVVVSQHSKPSFLYSYMLAHLINVKTQKQVANYGIELKGNHVKVTEHGVKSLAKKINESLKK
jgi:Protein of unknown function (DUF2380)